MKGPELVFLHIPKTAGTTQQFEFNKYIGREHVFWVGRDCPPDVQRYPRSQIGNRMIVGGHKFLSFYPRGIDPLCCAVLRDPVERAISLFVYYTRPELALTENDRNSRVKVQRRMLAKGVHPGSMRDSIRESAQFRKEISNIQCRYLSRGDATFAGVRKSLRRRDWIIGTVGDFERFHRELWGLLGREDAAPTTANKSRDNYAAPLLQDEELVASIRELNNEDQQLVDWVETEHGGLWLNLRDARRRKERLRRLPRRAEPGKPKRVKWEEASGLWPVRGSRKLQWPLNRVMVAEPHRLLYMPNTGAVDGVVQRMMLELSSARHPRAVLALGLDRVVERYSTGLMLEDRSAAQIDAIVASGDYFRFSILYEPVARMIDAYRKCFVTRPDALSRWPRFGEMMAYARGRTVSDPGTGITFREFVRAVAGGKYNHRLWLPQCRYLPWIKTLDGLYRVDRLAELERDLARLRGLSIELPADPDARLRTWEPAGARYADVPAAELPADPAMWMNQLVDEAILEAIEGCYAWDFRLYNRISAKDLEVAGV